MKSSNNGGNGNGSYFGREIYVVRVPKSEIKTLQNSKKFILILRLCRFRNQIKFCLRSYSDYGLDTSPGGMVQRFNAFWFHCGVLHEAERIIHELGKEFRHFPSYQLGFGRFFRDPSRKPVRRTLLTCLRNQLIFHVDNDAIAQSLSTFDVENYEIVTWSPDSKSDFTYPLADEIVLNAFIEADDQHETRRWPFEELMAKVWEYSHEYSNCADDLIKEYVKRKGWPSVEDSAFYEPKEEDDLEEFLNHIFRSDKNKQDD